MLFRRSLAVLAVLAVVPSSASAAVEGRTVPGTALVLLEQSSPAASASAQRSVRSAASAVISRHGLRRAAADVPEVGVITVRVPPGMSRAGLARMLARDPRVAAVEPEAQHEPRLAPNDP